MLAAAVILLALVLIRHPGTAPRLSSPVGIDNYGSPNDSGRSDG